VTVEIYVVKMVFTNPITGLLRFIEVKLEAESLGAAECLARRTLEDAVAHPSLLAIID